MNYKKLVMTGVGVFALLLGLVGPFIPAMQVSAADPTSFTWNDAQTIHDDQGNSYIFRKTIAIGGITTRVGGSFGAVFVQSNPTDVSCTLDPSRTQTETIGSAKYSYKNTDLADYNGASVIIINIGVGVNGQKWKPTGSYTNGFSPVSSTPTVFKSYANPVNAQGGDSACQTNPYKDITIGNPSGATVLFDWIDSKTITSLPARGSVAYKNNDPTNINKYVATGSGTCHDYIIVAAAGASTGEYWKSSPNNSDGSGCAFKDTGPVQLGNTANAATAGTPTSGITSTSSSDTQGPSCETSGASLAWILCGVIGGLADAVNGAYHYVIQPMLVTPNTNGGVIGSHLKSAWSSFRDLADVFLIVALLVLIFGESLGGGVIDAYSVKKILPRLLAAAILINLSYYLVEIAVDVSNIVGGGLRTLITHPFGLTDSSGNFQFDLSTQSGAQQGSAAAAAGTVAISSAGIAGLFTASVIADGAIVSLLLMGLTSILLPFLFIVLAIVCTLIIRVALIFMLIMASPIAFALYALPNTEHYFKRWWKILQETLLVYPIISVMFGLSAVLSQTTIWSTSNSATGTKAAIGFLLALILLILPLVFIPFAFKLAGGLLGRVHELADGARKKAGENGILAGFRERNKQRAMDHSIQGRQNWRKKLEARQIASEAAGNGGRSRMYKAAYGLNNIGNLNANLAAAQARKSKEINDIIATGIDTEIRGLTVDKTAAIKAGDEIGTYIAQTLEDGSTTYKLRTGTAGNYSYADATKDDFDATGIDKEGNRTRKMRIGADGGRQFQSLGGSWINERDVDSGQSSIRGWKNDRFVQQAALSYEIRKANSDDQRKQIADDFGALAQDVWGMSDTQRTGAWVGATFENQNSNLAMKYIKQGTDKNGKATTTFDAKGFVQEVFEKRGSYAMSNMDASTIAQLTEAWDKGTADKGQLTEIAKTMQDRLVASRSKTGTGAAGAAAANVANTIIPGADGNEPTAAGAGLGAGHVAQNMDTFVTRVLGSGDGNGGGGGTPPPAGP